MNKYFRLLFVFVLVTTSFWAVSSPSPMQAATTISVATAAELIQAINDANSEAGDFVGADTIILDADITLVTVEGASSFVGGGQAGLPDIVTNITIQAGGGSTIERAYTTCDLNDNDPDFRLFNVMAGRIGGVLALEGITVQHGCIAPDTGVGTAYGGGIYVDSGASLSLSDSIVSYNTVIANGSDSAGGGGIYNGGTISSITNSVIAHNTAQGGDSLEWGGAADGGGIITYNTITLITNSTIAYNTAQGGDGTPAGGRAGGGGIAIAEGTINQIVNSTVAHNTAQGGDGENYGSNAYGGGINNLGLASLANSTVAANHARGGTGSQSNGIARGGGLLSYNTSVYSSILADNDVTHGGAATTPNDCELSPEVGNLTSDGYNVVEVPESCTFANTGDQTGSDPSLGTLADNGCTETLPGSACVETMAITDVSPAYDQGSCELSGITEDERGADFSRPQDDPAVTNADDGCDSGAFEAPYAPVEVDLAVSVTESTDPVLAGSGVGNLTYVVTVTNTSTNGAEAPARVPSRVPATGVALNVTLTLPAGVTVDSATPSAGAFADPVWTVGPLDTAASETLTIVLTVDDTAAAGTDVISATATITAADQTDPNATNDTDTEATSIIVLPEVEVDLVVTKNESVDPVEAGSGVGNLTYVVAVRNTNPTAPATGVVLTEVLTLPAGVTVDSITPSVGTFVSPIWMIGLIPPGGRETLVVVLTVDDTAEAGTDVISDTATITAVDQVDPDTTNNSATEATSIIVPGEPQEPETPVVPAISDPSLSKIGVLQPGGLGVPGEQITWTITVTAPSSGALTNVTITDTFPPELRVDNVTTTVGTATLNGQIITVTIPYLGAGTSAQIRVTTTVLSNPAVPYIDNTAYMTADGGVSLMATARVPLVQSLPNTGYPPGN